MRRLSLKSTDFGVDPPKSTHFGVDPFGVDPSTTFGVDPKNLASGLLARF